jgi:hypothetical protein
VTPERRKGAAMAKAWDRLFRLLRGSLVVLALLFGPVLLFNGCHALGFAREPVTAVAELERHAETGRKVRVEGSPTGESVVHAADGEPIVFQKLRVVEAADPERDRPAGGRRTSEAQRWDRVLYEAHVPERLTLRDDTGEVEVEVAGVDERFLPPPLREVIREDGVFPGEIDRKASPEFDETLMEAGRTAVLWHVPNGERLTVYGVVSRREGRLALRADTGDSLYIISPLPPEQIAATSRAEGIAGLVMGPLFFLAGLAAALYLWLPRRRASSP